MWGLSFEQSAPGIWMKNWEDIESIDPCDGGPVQTLILPSFMILKDQSCVIFSMIYGDCCQMCNTLTPVTSISPNTTSTALVTASYQHSPRVSDSCYANLSEIIRFLGLLPTLSLVYVLRGQEDGKTCNWRPQQYYKEPHKSLHRHKLRNGFNWKKTLTEADVLFCKNHLLAAVGICLHFWQERIFNLEIENEGILIFNSKSHMSQPCLVSSSGGGGKGEKGETLTVVCCWLRALDWCWRRTILFSTLPDGGGGV